MELQERIVERAAPDKLKSQRLIIAIVTFFCSVCLGMSAAIFTNVLQVYNNNSGQQVNFSSIEGIKNAVNDMQQIVKPLDKKMNVLVLGSDISYGGGHAVDSAPTRSDSMLLAQIDPQSRQVNLLSIPRDSRVLIPGFNYYDKINAAFSYGGESLARATVESLTGLQIDHFVILKLNGLVNIVDILGGVEINVDKPMQYRDNTAGLNINLAKGPQTLNGREAHHYVRFRHDNLGDIGRVQRQQKFIRAVITKLLQPATIIKIPVLVQAVKDNIISNIPQVEMLRAAYFLKDLRNEQVKMVMLPGEFGFINRISYWVVDALKARTVITGLFPDSALAVEQPAGTESEKQVDYRITLRDAGGDRNTSLRVAAMLAEYGWNVTRTEQVAEPAAKTRLIVQTGQGRAVPELLKLFNIPVETINESVGDISTDFTIVLGRDLTNSMKRRQELLLFEKPRKF